VPSTIVDATGPRLRVVRNGAVSLDQLREHVPGVLGLGEIPMAEEEPAEEEPVVAEPASVPAPKASGASGSSVVEPATPDSGTPAGNPQP